MADEYIKRETAIEIIDNYGKTISKDCIAVYQAIRDIVDEICPAADVVEVVHSKWIKRNNERRCPICHFFYMTNGTTVYNLCPMCGAKMDGERKAND